MFWKNVLDSLSHGSCSAIDSILYKAVSTDFGEESVAICKSSDSVKEKMNSIIGAFVLYGHSQTAYSKDVIQATSVLNVMNGTDGIRRIRATSTEHYLSNENDGSSAGDEESLDIASL